MYQEAIKEQSAKRKRTDKSNELETRPSRRGYTRAVEGLYDVKDAVVLLRAELGKWKPSTTERAVAKRPWFPAEVTKERMRLRSKGELYNRIDAARENWEKLNDQPT